MINSTHLSITKNDLQRLYIVKNLTPVKIGEMYNCSFTTIRNRIKQYRIPLKDPAIARMRYTKKDFSGDLKEKAYMLGFRLGDLNVYSPSPVSQTIVVRCHTTQWQQVKVMEILFKKYGKFTASENNGHFHVNCFLNRSFAFLLEKNDDVWKWVQNNPLHAMSFIAGYTDAEGNFILNQGRARFKIDSYDFTILEWMSRWLIENVVATKFRKIYSVGDHWNGAFPLNKDLWRLNINEKNSIQKFIDLLLPLSLHKIRIKDAKMCLKNIKERNDRNK
jgi:hypothetical protein